MYTDNPFASFLAARPTPEPCKLSSQTKLPLFSGLNTGEPCDVNHDGPHDYKYYRIDEFSTFLSGRPQRPSQEFEQLKADVFRTKHELLRIAVDAEVKAVSETEGTGSPFGGDASVSRLQRIKVAQRYLENPHRVGESFSGTGTQHSDDGLISSRASLAEEPGLRDAGVSETEANVSDVAISTEGTGKQNSTVLEVCTGNGDGEATQCEAKKTDIDSVTDDTQSRAVSPSGTLSRFGTPSRGKGDTDKGALLSGFYSKTRCFNVMVSKDCLQSRRWQCATPGGCFVLGNGRLPFFTGSHLLNRGYYWSFKVDVVEGTTRRSGPGASLAVGVSIVMPSDSRLQGSFCPLYAYEIPSVVLAGYGSNYIENGKWYHSPWDSTSLEAGDVVGVMITSDGDFILFVNDQQLMRTKTNLIGTGSRLARTSLHAVVDLCGHVAGITLLPLAELPNVPLAVAGQLKRKIT